MGSQRRSLPPLPSLSLPAGILDPGVHRASVAVRARVLAIRLTPAAVVAIAAVLAGGLPTTASSAACLPRLASMGPAATMASAPAGVTGATAGHSTESVAPLCLAGVEDALRTACGRDDLRISWALSTSVGARLAAHPEARVTLVEGEGCADRVVVQVEIDASINGSASPGGRADGNGNPNASTSGTANAGGGANPSGSVSTSGRANGSVGVSRYLLTGNVEVFGLGMRALRTLKAGALVGDEDVAVGEDWFPPSALLESGAEAVGAYVLRSVPAGQAVSTLDLGAPPLVRRGETVRVIYRGHGLELRTVGTARSDGWRGDRLAVRASGAQHDCAGIVAGPDLIEIDSEGSRR